MNPAWYQPLGIMDREQSSTWSWGGFELALQASGAVTIVRLCRNGEPSDPLRFLSRDGRDRMLTARTADRSVVARPAMPLVVNADGHAVIYVSSPLWVGLAEIGAPPFVEFPITEPKQTWLGATPQAGELVYATHTQARMDLGNLDVAPGRVVTQVELVNRLPEPWPIERIVVPLPHLALHQCDASGGPPLWTSSVRIERTTDAEVDAHVAAGPPLEAGQATRIAEPRQLSIPRLSLLALSRWAWS